MTRLFKHTQTLRDAAGLPALPCTRPASLEWPFAANSSYGLPCAVASDIAGTRQMGVFD